MDEFIIKKVDETHYQFSMEHENENGWSYDVMELDREDEPLKDFIIRGIERFFEQEPV